MINLSFIQLKFPFSAVRKVRANVILVKLKKERMKGTKRIVNQKGKNRKRKGEKNERKMKKPGKVKIWAMENFNAEGGLQYDRTWVLLVPFYIGVCLPRVQCRSSDWHRQT